MIILVTTSILAERPKLIRLSIEIWASQNRSSAGTSAVECRGPQLPCSCRLHISSVVSSKAQHNGQALPSNCKVNQPCYFFCCSDTPINVKQLLPLMTSTTCSYFTYSYTEESLAQNCVMIVAINITVNVVGPATSMKGPGWRLLIRYARVRS